MVGNRYYPSPVRTCRTRTRVMSRGNGDVRTDDEGQNMMTDDEGAARGRGGAMSLLRQCIPIAGDIEGAHRLAAQNKCFPDVNMHL